MRKQFKENRAGMNSAGAHLINWIEEANAHWEAMSAQAKSAFLEIEKTMESHKDPDGGLFSHHRLNIPSGYDMHDCQAAVQYMRVVYSSDDVFDINWDKVSLNINSSLSQQTVSASEKQRNIRHYIKRNSLNPSR